MIDTKAATKMSLQNACTQMLFLDIDKDFDADVDIGRDILVKSVVLSGSLAHGARILLSANGQ